MNVKQVLVIRKDLNMRKGKIAAQAAHASIAFLLDLLDRGEDKSDLTRAESEWANGQQTKICVSVDSEEELLTVRDKALESGLTVHLITDAGKTEFGGVPTTTCLAIGPNDAEEIDKVTGGLSLL